MATCNGGADLVATSSGPTMFARIGVMRALNRTLSACLIQIGRITTGAPLSWRGIDDPGCGPTALHAHGVAGPSHAGLMSPTRL